MKRVTGILTLALLFAGAAYAQNGGIEFFHGTFAEALAKGKQEKKIVFVDAYTAWCGPCRFMAANVFTDPGVGAVYNANFINVKLDMEKGEGPAFAKKYQIMGYPSLLYFKGDGSIVNRELGGKSVDQFISIGKKVKAGNP